LGVDAGDFAVQSKRRRFGGERRGLFIERCFDCRAIKEARGSSISLGQVIEVRKKDARGPPHLSL